MLTLVINLDRDTERLKRIEALLAERDVAFTRVPAVDGRLLAPDEIAAVCAYPTPVSIRLQPGEIACYLSHIKAWRLLLDSDEDCAAIFEDDIDLSRDAAEVLSAIADWMPDDADIVKLETSLRPIEIAPGEEAAIGDRAVRRLAGCHIGSAGYLISREAAARMLAESKKLRMAVDSTLFDPRGGVAETLSLYQLSPALCIQTRLQSTDESADKSNISERANHKSYGATLGERLANRIRDRLAYACRRIRNFASGARAQVIDFKP
ncbi:glycosyltransferase family 25 protein [Martelella mediterranea]|uniref:glycosyltransferase family 25 protein n=1 Tax=Martelella mediterranea TaxID=293089 RepID=UPI001E5F919B|nr:glycosyltransferase family 25 protein [Martelella mediterranea]MCD1632872.1 glycosyltransferase family 25 protein [Martelella mediterranea]